ncbi:trimethylamine methyltransferase family protein [Candidatus Bipolaricaulota bacterium]|nr:trimethylamine methyltransferase family protein [Candidatus Bipolaricaulota bacterium]
MIKQNFLRQDLLSEEDINLIHKTSMEIFEETGVEVHNQEAREIFEENGARVENEMVYLSGDLVEEYLEKAPASFTLHARNPENDVEIGGSNGVLAPGYGAPWVTDMEGNNRDATYEDYENFTKLASASDNLDVLGGVLVEPTDLADEERHVKMMYAAAKYSDKPLMGSALGKKKAREAIKMASILMGEDEIICDRPIVITLINTTSPLGYDKRMLEALMEHARFNQPTVIASLIMAGSTGPITVAGTITLQNVEVLTGIILSQMVNPGTPVVYGSASTIVDMNTGDLAVGSPEYAKFIGATAQLARHYDIPCRGGGSITDSLRADGQAGYESMMTFDASMSHGMDFVLHSAGLLKNYMAMSYEKFVMDDEILDMVNNYQKGLEVNEETVTKKAIQNVGHSGHYLKEPSTIQHMKDFRKPALSNRKGFDSEEGLKPTMERAHELYKSILEDFEAPPLDPEIDEKLKDYMERVT